MAHDPQKQSSVAYELSEQDVKEVKIFFKALDENGDGLISKHEAKKMGEGFAKFIRDCDADKDGNITEQELLKFLRENAGKEHPAIPVAAMFRTLTKRVKQEISAKDVGIEFKRILDEIQAEKEKNKSEGKEQNRAAIAEK
mmetsp:Transcript_30998/g.75599  ORF Transcript_30998/g.75599 Transcript_30998/m.75599 type:complete len:141 (+) Transcript_30998:170-592(+)|eukprot:CAMPEP_0114525186 /NCGR_PEP_ID=MMETSP0109-20121206/22274_1 /TAXON_ID=29199 /ORGANISM="Chlorarachnion reptans, Strain CCCM449" /LENGTH=140 /DNA_ID=CAMNT_0001706719 /DNA_START=114 /DNA_END=536 /DNA_ORIENTATION=+